MWSRNLGRVIALCVSMTALLLPAAVAIPARAAFPGANGRFVFSGMIYLPDDTADVLGTTGPRANRMHVVYHTANESEYLGAPKWSPSGDWIVYVREEYGALMIVRANGSGSTRLFRGDVYSPTWSPNGSRVAFGWRNDIYTVRRDGTHVSRLTRTPRGGEFDLDWSSRHMLAFDRHGQIYTVHGDGTGLRQVTTGRGDNWQPNWAPGGGRLVYVHGFDSSEIWTMRLDGSRAAPLGVAGVSPVWAPDGSRIAYVGGGAGVIHTVAPDGTGDREIGRPRGAHAIYSIDWQAR